MRVQRSQESKGGSTPFPYGARPEEPRTGYVDLKTKPEKINELDTDITDSKSFVELLGSLNGRDSQLLTVNSAKLVSEHDFYPFKCTSWLDIMFEDLGRNTEENVHRLAIDIEERLKARNGKKKLLVELVIEDRYYLCRIGKVGFNLRIWMHGYGNTPEGAYRRWEQGTRELVSICTQPNFWKK